MANGGDGAGKKKKVPKIRADMLLVERGLAAHANAALALILKRLVVADEGKIIVDKSSTMLPHDVPLRVKGHDAGRAAATPTFSPIAGAGSVAAAGGDAEGFTLGCVARSRTNIHIVWQVMTAYPEIVMHTGGFVCGVCSSVSSRHMSV